MQLPPWQFGGSNSTREHSEGMIVWCEPGSSWKLFSLLGSARDNAGTTEFGGICGFEARHSVIHFATLVSGALRVEGIVRLDDILSALFSAARLLRLRMPQAA
jgi:hypothetical protein